MVVYVFVRVVVSVVVCVVVGVVVLACVAGLTFCEFVKFESKSQSYSSLHLSVT